MIAFYSAIRTAHALSKRKILNENLQKQLETARREIEQFAHQNNFLQKQLDTANQGFNVRDNQGNGITIPYDYFNQYNAFSVYNMEGKSLYFSPKLLSMLGTTQEEVFAYQEEHGEVVTLFYPDEEERIRIAGYQSDLKRDGQPYEETFFPRRVDNQKKLALRFNTIPRRDEDGKIIGTYRFAADVTGDHRENIDLLTGESDKTGFAKKFHDIVMIKKQREKDPEKT